MTQSGVPHPEARARLFCRVDGCGERVVTLSRAICYGYGDAPELTEQNHGFCRMHFEKIPRAFFARWEGATSMHALERIWTQIADDYVIEERRKR